MSYLYQVLTQRVDAWRAANYPCDDFPAIREILEFATEDGEAAFVVKPRAEREALLNDARGFALWLDSIPSGKGRQLYHTLCHILFPDNFERIFSQGNKYQVARAHKIWTPALGESRPAMDAALQDLRKRLEMQHPGAVDYYELPVGTLIKQQGVHPGKSTAKASDGDGVATEAAPHSAHEPDPEYDVEAATNAKPTLRLADNLILFGPPGTGKTYEMQARMSTRPTCINSWLTHCATAALHWSWRIPCPRAWAPTGRHRPSTCRQQREMVVKWSPSS